MPKKSESSSIYQIQKISDHSKLSRAFHIFKLEASKANIDLEYHKHEYHEIIIFEKGGGENVLDFVAKDIPDLVSIFVLPGQIHRLARSQQSNGYAILFSEELVIQSNTKNNPLLVLPFYNPALPNELPISKEDYSELGYLIEKLIKEEKDDLPMSYFMASSYLTMILALLARISLKVNVKQPSSGNSQTNSLINFKKLIEENFEKGLKPSDYAERLHVSTSHLNDLVKSAFNKTTGEIIQERIILEAKRLLFYTELTVNEISYQLGMDDPAYFTRLFKKHTSASPKEYRLVSREKSK